MLVFCSLFFSVVLGKDFLILSSLLAVFIGHLRDCNCKELTVCVFDAAFLTKSDKLGLMLKKRFSLKQALSDESLGLLHCITNLSLPPYFIVNSYQVSFTPKSTSLRRDG